MRYWSMCDGFLQTVSQVFLATSVNIYVQELQMTSSFTLHHKLDITIDDVYVAKKAVHPM